MNVLRSWTHIGKAHKYFYKYIITYGRSLFHRLYYYRCCCNHVELIAFAFNARGFANTIPVFFLFVLLVSISGRTAKIFLENVLRLIIK